MNALVTGGAGFIGSNLVAYLLDKGVTVRVMDNLSSGYKENLKDMAVEFIQADIQDADACKKACEGQDVVFHMAASVGRQRSIDYPQLDSSINLIGTINILEGMRANCVKKIVYSSSAAIFGELQTNSIDETHPQNADSPYGVSKLAAEKMILAYADIHGIEAVCLRYFNIYGINQRFDLYGNAIPIFAKRLFSEEPITIFGDGEQTRDFVNVRDVARVNYLAAMSAVTKDVFNIGSGDSITINKLVSMMKEISGVDVPVQFVPKRLADTLHCKAMTAKVMHELGFEASVGLEQGLKEYLSWFGTL
jgi:nucleoside-diphosphate-sugar epimerase